MDSNTKLAVVLAGACGLGLLVLATTSSPPEQAAPKAPAPAEPASAEPASADWDMEDKPSRVSSDPSRGSQATTNEERAAYEEARRKSPPKNELDPAELVHYTDSGKRYHRKGCQHLASSDELATRKVVERQGLMPCQHCHPEIR